MSSLPWFIWREIINYTINYDTQYCLLNKEWFVYTANQYITLDNTIIDNKEISHWFKLAEKLKISEYSKVNWEFLNVCHRIRNVELNLTQGLVIDYEILEAFLFNSNLTALSLNITHYHLFGQAHRLLIRISKILYTLKINCYEPVLDCNTLFLLEYSNIIEFAIKCPSLTICFEKIHKAMPKVQYLSFISDNIAFQQPPKNKLWFSYIKTLKISKCSQYNFEAPKFLENLFIFCFPALTHCVLYIPYNYNIHTISQSMPNLKILSIFLDFEEHTELIFPDLPLLYLRELTLNYAEDLFCDREELLYVDLNNMPQLLELKVNNKAVIFSSKNNHLSLITKLFFKATPYFQYKSAFELLPFIKEVTIDYYENFIKFSDFVELFNLVSKLNIRINRSSLLVGSFPSGSFKTTHLQIFGTRYLNNQLLNWLASQPQLVRISLYIESNNEATIDDFQFPYLQQLNIWCKSRKLEAYFKPRLSIKLK